MINWTREQQEIIDDRGNNLIVSAAAGSGKTAVLIERIFRMLKNKDVSIKNILMITFTVKAAREMKEKLQSKLEEYILKNHDEHLERELKSLETADIKTIDSFCKQVVTENYGYLGFDIEYQVLDDYGKKIIEEKALDILFEKEYEIGDPLFLKNINTYTNVKSDKAFRDIILKLYDFAGSNAEPFKWLENSVQPYYESLNEFIDSKLGIFYFENIVRREFIKIDSCLDSMEKAVAEGAKEYRKNLAEDKSQWEDKKKLFKNKDFISFFEVPFSFSRIAAVKKENKSFCHDDFGNMRTKLKKQINSLIGKSLAEKIEVLNKARPEALYIAGMVRGFTEILMQLKKEENAFDYTDIEHFALEILTNKDIGQEYRNYYEYIFVDEYQDSNSLQEKIFSLIRRRNNIFYVGDVKQSIYRFRLADSSIFLKTIEEYSQAENSRSLTLNKNFRSSEGIINGVNSIFNYLMDGSVSPVNYKEEAQLVWGSDIEVDNKVQSYIIKDLKDYSQELKDENNDFFDKEKTIQEAVVCAKKIRELIDAKKYRYQDFVILGKSIRFIFDRYKEVFDAFDIPLYGESDTGFIDSLIVQLAVDYLEVVNNIYNDLALINILKSQVYGIAMEELGLIRNRDEKRDEHNFIDSIHIYLENKDHDVGLKNKLEAFLKDINYFKELLNENNLVDFIIKVLIKTNLYFLAFKKEDYQEERINLNELLKLAGNYEANNQNHLRGFLQYFQEVKKRELSIVVSSQYSERGNVVRMQTIHKSKGLEYKNVFLIKMGDRLSSGKDTSAFLFHKRLGFGPLYLDEDRKEKITTLAKETIRKAKEYEEAEDNYNLLYVAMTRAKENLYLVGTYKDFRDKKEGLIKKIDIYDNPTTFYDMILPYILGINEVGEEFELIEVEEVQKTPQVKKEIFLEDREETPLKIRERKIFQIPKKLTATDFVEVDSINKALTRDLLKGELKIKPDFLEEKKIEAVEKGILFHLLMEILDFNIEYDENILVEKIAALVQKGIIRDQEAQGLDLKGLLGFFKSPIYQRVQKADSFEKEKAFNILIDPKLLHRDYKGEDSILVQGIIDLYFIEKGKGVLIDYKTDYLDVENERAKVEHYSKQLLLYKEALEKIKAVAVEEAYLYFSREEKFTKVELGGLYD